jgi:hypothetical protein
MFSSGRKLVRLTNCLLNSMKLNPSWKATSLSRISQHSLEHRNSLPCSQEPFTSPYSESNESCPYAPHSISLRSVLILSSRLRLGLLNVGLHSNWRTQWWKRMPIFLIAH